jgi:hypothetical protein
VGTRTIDTGVVFQVDEVGRVSAGTISVTASSATVTGTGTEFLSSFRVGSTITANGETHTITSITSDVLMATETAWTNTFSGAYSTASGTLARMLQNGTLALGALATTTSPGTGIGPASSTLQVAPLLNMSASTTNTAGITSDVYAYKTIAGNTNVMGTQGSVRITASNTANWGTTSTNIGATGMYGQISSESGATGAISSVAGFRTTLGNSAPGLTYTRAYGYQLTAVFGSNMTSIAGLALTALTTGTNNTYALLGTLTIPTGNWGIYSATTYDSYFAGSIGIGAITPTSRVDVTGAQGYNQFRMRTSYTPTATGDTNGNTGDMAWDADYIYIKTGAGWKRTALSTF